MSVDGAKAKTMELLNCHTENGEPYMKKSLCESGKRNGKGEKRKREIIYDIKCLDRADQMYHYPCFR